MLVVEVTAIEFATPWTIAIHSEKPNNYSHRRCLEGRPPYDEALREQDRKAITDRLVAVTYVTSPIIAMNIGVN